MRVESYERDLKGGYKIIGFNGGMVDFSPRHGQPLEMRMFYGNREITFAEEWERYVFPHVNSDMFHNQEYSNQNDFIQNWPDIMLGRHGDWKLDVVEVTPVSVILEYRIPSLRDGCGFVWLTVPDAMYLEIKGPAISHEVIPVYTIKLYPNSKTAHITEDMRHTVRDIRLRVKNPGRPVNPIYVKQPYSDNPYSDNQYAEITEYVCM